MSSTYKPILWNPFKRKYDVYLWFTILLYIIIFIGFSIFNYPSQNIYTTVIRATGTLAILLLHIILLIGPLTRLSNKILPILYNRRHLGVSMFIIALIHSLLSLVYYHANGNLHPLLSLFKSNLHYNSLVFFPFQILGFFALIILAVMAFTSHDFWLHFLGRKFWKVLHMLVYVAYALIILHVALGIIQFEKNPLLVVLLFTGFFAVAGLHLYAAVKENMAVKKSVSPLNDDWNYVCRIDEIDDDKAKMVNVKKERVAIFKYDGKLSAVHNVCKHQMGPLSEGKIIDGCITCPWHGYQYRPEDGCAPAPFTDKVATYSLKLQGAKIFVNSIAMAEGTYIEPVEIVQISENKISNLFFIGWAKNAKELLTVPGYAAIASSVFIIMIGIGISKSQQNISGFAIDYSQVEKMEGWLSQSPVPNLKIIDSKDAYGNPVYKSILLMDGFKFGADAIVRKVLNGDSLKYVRLTGYINSNITGCNNGSKDCIEICSQCIIGTTNHPIMEIENGQYSFEAIPAPVDVVSTNISSQGKQTLRGEIIDPKCYFGAMNPGQGKSHLSCAARCISGGIMPVIKYEINNQNRYAVLVGLNGEKINRDVLNYIGVPVEIKGNLSTMDNWGVLKIDTKDITIVNSIIRDKKP